MPFGRGNPGKRFMAGTHFLPDLAAFARANVRGERPPARIADRRPFREITMNRAMKRATTRKTLARALLAGCAWLAHASLAQGQGASPWPAGDELGMANTLGPAT